MKLVQLLAKELKEWPENIEFLAQDSSGGVFGWIGRPEYYDDQWILNGDCDIVGFDVVAIDISDDYKSSLVTKLQWQAEREKMNKPKWIRHRGGWMPVGAATIVEVRLRCGDIQKHEACEFLWRHKDCDSAVNIMAYRVIEETKDQEIEEVIPKHMAFGYASKEEMVAQIGEECPFAQVASVAKDTNLGTLTYKMEIDATEATKEIDRLVAKWGQIVSPLKWRDAIIHCQAIIEDCEREIERNVNLLDAEGLMMQKDSKNAIQHYSSAKISPTDWQSGDIVRCVERGLSCADLTVGREYVVVDRHGEIGVVDDEDDHMISCIKNGELEFIRRP